MTTRKVILTCALALVGAALLPAITRAEDDVLTKTVTYIDLDLTRTEGAATLYNRISSAAESVCVPLTGRSPREFRLWRRCIDETIDRAVAEKNTPTLTAYHLTKRGKSASTRLAGSQRREMS